MPLFRDKILVVDIEATCWKDNIAPEGQQSEIIEIGCVFLNLKTLEPEKKRSILVKPVRSKVSPFCTELTTITPQMVADGVRFAEACRTVREAYNAHRYVWLSWGRYDHRMFKDQCRDFNTDYPFSDAHCNGKQLFADLHQRRRRVGLKRAITMSGLEAEGTPHRGADDAWNTARVIAGLVKTFGTDIFLPYWMG